MSGRYCRTSVELIRKAGAALYVAKRGLHVSLVALVRWLKTNPIVERLSNVADSAESPIGAFGRLSTLPSR